MLHSKMPESWVLKSFVSGGYRLTHYKNPRTKSVRWQIEYGGNVVVCSPSNEKWEHLSDSERSVSDAWNALNAMMAPEQLGVGPGK